MLWKGHISFNNRPNILHNLSILKDEKRANNELLKPVVQLSANETEDRNKYIKETSTQIYTPF